MNEEITRLPLWRGALEQLQKNGVEHGQTISAEWFEERLKCKRDEMEFGLSMSAIRRELEKDGYHISGRGQGGAQFIILPPENHAAVMAHYQRIAIDCLKRGVILGTATRIDLLNAEDRRRHESLCEKMATRSVLMARSGQIAKAIKEKAPKLLET